MEERLWPILLVATALAEVFESILLIYCSSSPIIVFRGSVQGWVSLIGYSVSVLGQAIDSHIYDYLSFMSVLVFLAAGLAITFSLAAIASLRNTVLQRVAIPGLFASSLILLVAVSILRALLELADIEAHHIQVKSIHTSAGLIVFPHEEIIHTHVYDLATSTWHLVLILLAVLSSSYLLYTMPSPTMHSRENMVSIDIG